MEGQIQDDFGPQVRRYLLVFYVLLFGTLITVGASYIPFGSRAINIGVALFIASGKAALVAGFFMHLISERKMIYGILGFTLLFVIGLMFLTVWSFTDVPPLTRTQ
jgi:cytochrome c oxidase subunit IV